ncbi:MAG: tetratricopeptide repeat protein [Saprospiraceae bacterium]|nr:tetratricopeptide repeat protein [Saprospiraceae bacterium]
MEHFDTGSSLPLNFMLCAWKRNACSAFVTRQNEFFYHHLLRYQVSVGDTDAARALMHHALWHYPQSAVLHLRHAQLAFLSNRDASGPLENAQVCVGSDGLLDEITLYRAEAYLRLGKMDEALQWVTSLLSDADETMKSLRNDLAAIRIPEEGALPDLWADAAENPSDPAVFKKLWFYSELHQDFSENLVKYRDLLETHPYCCYAWFNLGLTFAALGRWQEALDALEYAFITEPDYLEAYRELADLAIRHAQWGRALEACMALTERTGPQADVLVLTGVCLAGQNRRQEAHHMYLKALKLDPRCADAHYRLGLMAADDQMWPAAETYLRRAIRLDANHPGCHAAMADVYERQGQTRAACSHAWKAIGLAPEEAAYWRLLALMLWRAGRRKAALEVLDQSLMHSDGVELMYLRAVCLFGLGRRNSALRQLRQALRSDYIRHTLLFEWQPALRDDLGVQTLLTGFRDRANSL